MQITILEITPPTPANPSLGYPAGKNYKITSTDARKFLCNPDKRPSDLNVGMVVEIDTWADKFNNLYINRFTVINEDSVPPIPVPMTPTPQPTAPQQPQTSQQAPIAEAGGHDVAELVGRDWSIILQAMINRNQTISPTNKIKWFLTLYSMGSKKTLELLNKKELTEEQILDLDNTTISGNMPDDEINF
jgi:hypothetical protein